MKIISIADLMRSKGSCIQAQLPFAPDKLDCVYYGREQSFRLVGQRSDFFYCNHNKFAGETVMMDSDGLIGEFSLTTGNGIISALMFNKPGLMHLSHMYGAREFNLGFENLNKIRVALGLPEILEENFTGAKHAGTVVTKASVKS